MLPARLLMHPCSGNPVARRWALLLSRVDAELDGSNAISRECMNTSWSSQFFARGPQAALAGVLLQSLDDQGTPDRRHSTRSTAADLPGLRALRHRDRNAAGKGRPINDGNATRFDLLDDLRLDAEGGRPMLALFRAQARRFPHEVAEMERHTLGSQTFVPLGDRRFAIVVARAGEAPASADQLAAFVTDGRQGVVLAPGTWHHALMAVDAGDSW
ncbi:ureidoglycolate lyase domain-containing protein [Ditylenchus destructor]|uniref:Ureidoglycolate lyase domain-containing protein n=1 Tax=Ditylenchus destructor TaxID=166010 RepID=A0AAD4QV21_9BILA|nr:ureidoglycolate lyase domain-containing protein [Ditylenchus destructor]